jgi:hypothetical protein
MQAANATATATAPAGTATELAGVEGRVAALRELDDPVLARDTTWAWFTEAGQRAGRDREGALAELAELFRSGQPSRGIDEQTEGILVRFTMQPLFDRAMAAITALWMPWLGKRFDDANSRGDNVLLASARLPAKLLWPTYAMRSIADGLTAFDFETRIEAGAVDPDREVLVIDYSVVDDNPRLLIKSIRDELVEVVPGAHLGKMLWRHGDERHSLLAYFALKTPVG